MYKKSFLTLGNMIILDDTIRVSSENGSCTMDTHVFFSLFFFFYTTFPSCSYRDDEITGNERSYTRKPKFFQNTGDRRTNRPNNKRKVTQSSAVVYTS